MRYYVTVSDTTYEVDIDENGVHVDGEPVEASALQVAGTDVHSFLVDGESHRVVASSSGKGGWEGLLLRCSHPLVPAPDLTA